MLNYHADSRWADDAVYLMGASYYGKAAYDSALVTLDGFIEGFPDSKFLARAYYVRGLCLYERGRYEEMEDAFDAALAADPELEEKDDILYTLARTAEKREDRAEAIRRFRTLVDTFPDRDRGEDGLLEIGRLYFEADRYDSALVAYSELADRTKNEDRYQRAQLQIGQSLVRLGRSGEAISRMERQIPREDVGARRTSDYPARVRLGIALAHNRLGQHDEAIERLKEVIEFYKASPYAPEAQYQIGYTYESYLDSLDAAEAAYEAAAKMTGRSTFRDLARERLVDLRKLRSLASQAGDEEEGGDGNEEKKAGAALQIAELYYYSQRDVPEALAQYRKVTEEYPETANAARAEYAMAWIYVEEDSLSDETGYEIFRQLVAEHPASEQARSAIEYLIRADADTSGLRALLVEPEPEPEPEPSPGTSAPSDSLRLAAGSGEGGGASDSSGVRVDVDSLGVGVSRLPGSGLPPGEARSRFSQLDSLDWRPGAIEEAPVDSVPDPRRRSEPVPADSLRGPVRTPD